MLNQNPFAELVHPGFFIPNFCKNQTVQLTPGCSQNKTRLCIIHSASGDGRSSGLLWVIWLISNVFISIFRALSISKYRYTLFNKKQKQSELHSDRLAGIYTRFPLCGTQEESLFYSVAAATAAFRCTGCRDGIQLSLRLIISFFWRMSSFLFVFCPIISLFRSLYYR